MHASSPAIPSSARHLVTARGDSASPTRRRAAWPADTTRSSVGTARSAVDRTRSEVDKTPSGVGTTRSAAATTQSEVGRTRQAVGEIRSTADKIRSGAVDKDRYGDRCVAAKVPFDIHPHNFKLQMNVFHPHATACSAECFLSSKTLSCAYFVITISFTAIPKSIAWSRHILVFPFFSQINVHVDC